MSCLFKKKSSNVEIVRTTSSTGVVYDKPIRKSHTQEDIEEFKRELSIDDHKISLEQLISRYETDIDFGLSQNVADKLLIENGPNCLISPKTTSQWIILCKFLFGGFNTLLWLCSILTYTSYAIGIYSNPNKYIIFDETLILAISLTSVIFITGLYGFYQEYTNISIMETFKKMTPLHATVIRDGQKRTIPSEEIVLGDIVEVKMGDIVPADIRLLTTLNMKVDNSSITGESMPISRTPDCTDSNPLETSNLAFYSSSVVEGRGVGIVIKCGDNTLIGRIAGLTTVLTKDESLIQKEIKIFVKQLTYVALGIAFTVFFISLLIIGNDFYVSLTFFIAMLVANVPEGLSVTLTACMTLTAKKMAKRHCLVKKLGAMESLGSVNVICSDKTGTLTENVMSVSHLWYDGRIISVINNFDDMIRDSEALDAILMVGMLCSTAIFLNKNSQTPINQWKCAGDATEQGILKMLEKLIGNVENVRLEYPKLCEIPFNSNNKFQVSVHLLPNGRCLLVMKGAPESVLDKCTEILYENQTVPMDDIKKSMIYRSIKELSNRGERILAFADLHLPKQYDKYYNFQSDRPNFPLTGLRFIGLMCLIDPPRASVPEAVQKCRNAGIQIIMVTGDHPGTAEAIAKKVGIISVNFPRGFTPTRASHIFEAVSSDDSIVITGNELRNMSSEELKNTLTTYKEIVFARTSPQQKLKIVETLQTLDLVVAVTGDGVNDSPALKKANIGIAMGITGSDVAKEAADIILLDDNFSSIILGIELGRLIYDNLKKSIAYVLTSNIPEIIPFFLFVMLDIPEMYSVMTILLINVGTDLWPAISLAYERPEADIMKRNPRNPKKDTLLSYQLIMMTYCQIGLLQVCACIGSYLMVMAMHGFFWNDLIGIRYKWYEKTVDDIIDSYGQKWTFKQRLNLSYKCYAGFFLSLVLTQIADVLVCRTRRLSILQQGLKNIVLIAGIMFEIILAGLVVFCPKLNTILQLEPVDLIILLPAIPYAIAIFIFDEIRKLIIRKYPNGFLAQETAY